MSPCTPIAALDSVSLNASLPHAHCDGGRGPCVLMQQISVRKSCWLLLPHAARYCIFTLSIRLRESRLLLSIPGADYAVSCRILRVLANGAC